MTDNGVVECPACSGEGYDCEILIDSNAPCYFQCSLCVGKGVLEQPIICPKCHTQISGPDDVDYSSPEFEDLVYEETCKDCLSKAIIVDGTNSGVYYTTASNTMTVTYSSDTVQLFF